MTPGARSTPGADKDKGLEFKLGSSGFGRDLEARLDLQKIGAWESAKGHGRCAGTLFPPGQRRRPLI
jgi:hypothetical protein